MTTRKQEEEFKDETPAASELSTIQGQKSLTDLLDEIETRANAATPGPWCYDNRGDKCNDIQIGEEKT